MTTARSTALWTMAVALTLTGCASGWGEFPGRGPDTLRIDGGSWFVRHSAAGDPAVLFESGGGTDHTVWDGIAARVRDEIGVSTIVYDRAGLGESDPRTGPYRIENEASAVTSILDRLGVVGEVILVAHSYGGWIAALVAEQDPRVAGIVFVDANVPRMFDQAGLDRIQATYRPQYEALREAYPELAATLIPTIEAYPESARRLDRVRLPASLPILDIVAENSWLTHPDDVRRASQAHAEFLAVSEQRQSMLAEGSSHDVMQDRPDVIVRAIERLVEGIR